MRHRLRILVGLAGATLMLAAGCGNPSGVDGDLVNGWQAIPPPAGFVPQSDTCHLSNFAEIGARSTYEEVDCTIKHRSETTFVGTYDSPAADASAPPAEGSAGSRAAYRVCDDRTTEYVGAPWRTGRFWIGVTHPSSAAWSGGARWFRCELLEISSIEDDGGLVLRIGSLRDALTEPATDLLLTCYAIQLDQAGAISTMPASACTARHNAEFVGIWDAGDLTYPAKNDQWEKFHDGCRKLIATYAKVPDDADLQYRTGVVSLPGGEDVWALGDHDVRCYAWLDGAELTSTLKGKGTRGMPIQYK